MPLTAEQQNLIDAVTPDLRQRLLDSDHAADQYAGVLCVAIETIRTALEAETAKREWAEKRLEAHIAAHKSDVAILRDKRDRLSVQSVEQRDQIATLRAEQERLTAKLEMSAMWADTLRAVTAERDAIAARLLWQPISAEHKTGDPFIVALIHGDRIWRCEDAKHNGLGWYTCQGGKSCHWATHCMPMPPAPTGEDGPR